MNQRKPNIVFVLTDDQGYGDLGCHGNAVLQTPNIDAFHKESVRLTNFHVGPTCAPTRSGLFTGHYANSTGVWHTVGGRSLLRKDEVTVADALKENGYATALFGKWHLGDNFPYRPHDRGFELAVMHGGGGITQMPDFWGNDYFDDTYFVNGEPKPFKGYCTDVFFNLAFEYIKNNKEKPFFCCITCNAPHAPFNVEKKYSDMYVDKVPKDGYEDSRARFYGMITNIDENFGKLEKVLNQEGIADDTILIFMTDNGTTCGGPGYNTCGLRGYKNSPYDGGHRVPFFIRYANGNLVSPRDINSLTANVDFMPTLLDLCGIGAEKYSRCRFHGKSLVPLLKEKKPDWKERAIVTDSQRLSNPIKWRQSSVMTEQWRLINGTELYDINADRGQTSDISAKHPDVVAALREEYEKWWDMVSVKIEEEIPISIGSSQEKETALVAHDWRNPQNPKFTDPFVVESNHYLVHQQGEVRRGLGEMGYFEIYVETSGRYSFELCRWPKEEDRPITEGIVDSKEGWCPDWIQEKNHYYYTGGVALPFVKAGLSIRNQVLEKKVISGEKHVRFELSLERGSTHLEAWFLDEEGNKKGAYYVYASLING